MASRFTKPIVIPKITGRTRVEDLYYQVKYDLPKKATRSIVNRNNNIIYTISCIYCEFYCEKKSYHEVYYEFEVHICSYSKITNKSMQE